MEFILLGVTIDISLNFNEHVSNLSKKASIKISSVKKEFPVHGFNLKEEFNESIFFVTILLLPIGLDES